MTIPYRPTFIAQVQAGNVKTITATDTVIHGTFKHAISYRPSGAKAVRTTEFATQIPDFANNGSLDRLLADNGVVVTAKSPAGTPWWQTLLVGIGPTFLFFGLWIFLMRRYGNQAGGMFSFGQSKARKYEPTTEKVTFADVAGIDEAKEELAEVVDFLRNPDKYRKLGAHIPRGVLLTGNPGTGKTLLAKAVAGEAGVPFFSMSASEFVEMIVGVGASRVRDLFKQAKEAAPSIVFIDEIDAIGRSRSSGAFSGGNDEREQTLNQILTEMDGFDATTGVIVLAATNRPDVLDSALLRPGRFDRRIPVQAPDKDGRKQILLVHTRNLPLAPDVNLDALAATSAGMVGADLANLANEAALLAARRTREQVTMGDFTRRAREDRARDGAQAADHRGRQAAHRLPRGRPRAGRDAHARRRPGAEDLDHPAHHEPRRHHLGARQRPLQLRQAEPARPRQGRDRRPRRRRGRLRRRDDRRGVRHPPGDPARSQHGRPLRNERGDRLPLRPAAGRRRLRPDARRLGGLRADAGSGSTTRCGASSARQHDAAVQLLADNREQLDSLAEALFQAETLEGPEAYAAAGLQTTPAEPALVG